MTERAFIDDRNEDPAFEMGRDLAMEYAALDGGVWILYDVEGILLVRSIEKDAPAGGKELGRAGPGPNGPFFLRWLQ